MADTINAAELCSQARSLWLKSESQSDLDEVVELYRKARSRTEADSNNYTTTTTTTDDADTDADDIRTIAIEKLALLLLQSGRVKEADSMLENLGYACRLSTAVLDYATEENNDTTACGAADPHHHHHHGNGNTTRNRLDSSMTPCKIWDNFLSASQLEVLQRTFLDPNAAYWKVHNYSVEPPSPYFSYVIPLDPQQQQLLNDYGALGDIILKLQEQVATWKPLVKKCTHVELWAHNRPHATGHQMHFDSDNEGLDATIRNPLVSCILYISAPHSGGPSLVTNQRRSSRRLATQGWSSLARPGRAVAFDGTVLHGVVPGKGINSCDSRQQQHSHHRVTLMMAFWKRIRVRPSPQPGAARPFPREAPWAQSLMAAAAATPEPVAPQEIVPSPVSPIYENVSDGTAWKGGLPDYSRVFQGF